MLNKKSIPYDVKSYYEFCTFFSLHQLIKFLARITCISATIIVHILASYPERVGQQVITDAGLSDHQLISCTIIISRIKRGTHKQIKFRLFKHYSTYSTYFKETLTSMNFPNYQKFNGLTEAYDELIQKIMVAFEKLWLQLIRQPLSKKEV